MSLDQYDNPLIARYASEEMCRLWGPQRKFRTWRELWVVLAEAEADWACRSRRRRSRSCKAHVDTIDFAAAERYERKLRHDVMAHVHAYGDACPEARGIIHLGATSCYVTDNTDLILLRESLELVRSRLVAAIDRLATFAARTRDLACLASPIFSRPSRRRSASGPACGPTTWCTTWPKSSIGWRRSSPRRQGHDRHAGQLPGLFGGDHAKVRELDELVADKLGFAGSYRRHRPDLFAQGRRPGAGHALGHRPKRAQVGHRLRLLHSRKELEEPFEEEQIGSSAMAYKRNPMRAERICGLARFVISLESSGGRHGRHAVAGAHARRQRQPPADAAASLPGRRRHPAPLRKRRGRASGLSAGDRPALGRRTAVHGHAKTS